MFNNISMRKLTLFFVLVFIPAISVAWGPKGHDVVAYIAEQHLSKRAKRSIEQILDGHSMVYVANWMDNASHTPEYSYTKTWHYCNIEHAEDGYEGAYKEPKGDVVVAINDIVLRLKSGELSVAEERVQLMMLIHLVGDLHNPMHVGRVSDRGGNGVKVKFFGKSTNLHSAWDSDIVEAAHRWSYKEWQEQIDRVTKNQCKSYMQGDVVSWISDTLTITSQIYEETPAGTNISYDYVAKYTPIIEEQLLKGGIRLASLLEEIY